MINTSPNERRPVAVDHDEHTAGRAAAVRLTNEWPDVSWVPEEPSEEWASAAVERFAELIREQRSIFLASQKGARRVGRSLSPRPFQGIIEVLQNADDLGASELRIAIRPQGKTRELLMVHDGNRVRLDHVGAMVLPGLTTKEDDPEATGRFGIGQQTLQTLGGPLEVHCAPFRYRIKEDGPVHCGPETPIPVFYQPEHHETLFIVPLLKSVDSDDLRAFIEGLGSQSLLFLSSIRRISFFDLKMDKRIIDHRLVASDRGKITLNLAGNQLSAERMHLRDPRSRRQYIRYVVKRPLSKDEPKRDDKATGKWTPLGIALPVSSVEMGHLYDRLPMQLAPGFPFSLNAQFDPDSSRTTLKEVKNGWNERRLQDLGSLVAAVALDLFKRNATAAWSAVPLQSDVNLEENSWLAKQLQDSVVAEAQRKIQEEFRLKVHGKSCALRDLVFEETVLDSLLTPDDQKYICPEYFPVLPEQRDNKGRWRKVLLELDEMRQIDVTEALGLLDQKDMKLGSRDPDWFIAMAYAAIEADVFADFQWKRGIILSDNTRIEPPGGSDPRALTCHVKRSGLADDLEISLPIHPAYLGESKQAKRVVTELREVGSLCDHIDSDEAALKILARNHDDNTIGRLRLEDDQLLALRNAFERLDKDAQRALGPEIGRNIELRAHVYDDNGQKSAEWTSPTEAYLPTAIVKETDGFAKTAAQTTGIYWLDSGYASILKRTGGRRLPGAQKFLVHLGAATAPRLIRPDNERKVYKVDPRQASKVLGIPRPELQMLEIRQLEFFSERHLLSDRWSPDLDAVIDDICSEKNIRRRRQRGLSLLGILTRSWDRYYSDYEKAKAVYGHHGWNDPHDVIATWLARIASKPWLPNATGAFHAPMDLCLPNEASRRAYGDDKSMFLAKVDKKLLRSPALVALRLRHGPSATELIERLGELQEGPLTPEAEAEVRTAYYLLAKYCSTDSRRSVDNMSVQDLRKAFAGHRGRAGLLLINNRWCTPKDVFAGEHIFGLYRPFVPRSSEFEPLWQTLELREPEANDCVAVLREISKTPLNEATKAIVLQTVRTLAVKLDSLSPNLRRRLRHLPLWTGQKWKSERPIYVFEDETLAEQAAKQVDVWESGFSSLTGLDQLLKELNVVALRLEDFRPVEFDGVGHVVRQHIRQQFGLAIEHLRDELAGCDQPLHDSLLEVMNWRDLISAQVVVQENLQLIASAKGKKRIVVSSDAFLQREPLTLIVRSEDLLETAEAGGHAIASLFAGDRQKVSWAWVSMWQRAACGYASKKILLSTEKEENQDGEGIDGLLRLKGQAKMRGTQRSNKKGARGSQHASTERVVVQPLKDLDDYVPDEGTIVNAGKSRGGVIFPTADRAIATLNRAAVRTGAGQSDQGARTSHRTVPAHVTDREQLAYDAVRKALQLDDSGQIADLRKRHGLGADAMDELRQFYEIKMNSSGEIPKEVTLKRSQVDAAQDTEDFFLAVVTGLSDDNSELRVKFIFKPFERLAVRIKGEMTLSGISDVESLNYRFKKNDLPS